MSEVVEICLVYQGGEAMVFDRLAWWLTAEGIGEMRRMHSDPTWGLPTMIGFDALGTPVELPPETPGKLLSKLIQENGPRILPGPQADAVVRDFLATGIKGDPMTGADRYGQARLRMLRFLYRSRSKTWLERVH
jgi:hypothetical protein